MHFKNSVSHVLRSWKKHLILQVSTLAVLFGTFFIICLFGVLGLNFQKVLALWGDQVQMTIYLKSETPEESKSAVARFLEAQSGVKEVRFVDQKEALDSFQKQIGTYAPNLLNDPEIASVIPESFVLNFEKAFLNQASNLSAFAEKIKSQSSVEDVTYGQEWISSFSGILNSLSLFSKSVIAVLLAASLLVIGNCIRSSVQQRRHEIEVLELVGATSNWIRMPFVIEGFLMGFVSSTLAVVSCYSVLQVFKTYGLQGSSFSHLSAQLSFFPFLSIFGIILFAGALGALGSYLCVRRINTGWAARG